LAAAGLRAPAGSLLRCFGLTAALGGLDSAVAIHRPQHTAHRYGR
jgi:hypothetical protein